ncbi:MAG: hypothetical protein ACXWTP_00105 [Methylosarcina sp.]
MISRLSGVRDKVNGVGLAGKALFLLQLQSLIGIQMILIITTLPDGNAMNWSVKKIVSLIKSDHYEEKVSEASKDFTRTAAVPGPEEPKALHPGRRRVKENFTSHWDLDYLPRKEVDKIMEEAQSK